MADNAVLPPLETIRLQVAQALSEDVGNGDLTAALLLEQQMASAQVITREPGVLCGSLWVDEVFHQVDETVTIEWHFADGDMLGQNQSLCHIQGNARSLLTAERAALNFLQTLSGTATITQSYVHAVGDLPVKILDTRKTIPGLRLAQKYAVACGGGYNHRIGLYDAILIKENHIQAAGSITAVLEQAYRLFPNVEIEIEVESLQELDEALSADAKRVLLDNFSVDMLHQAVKANNGRARLEVSGNVTLETIRELAATGIDDISIGALTKHVHAFDFSMLFEEATSV